MTVGIGEILDSDRRIESQKVAAVVLYLAGQCCRIEIGGSRVGEGVAGDFVALAVKCHNLIAADSVPMAGPFIDQPARDIERRPALYASRIGTPTAAALFGASSNVKLTIGPWFRNRNGDAQKCMAKRLLTRAFSADQSGRMIFTRFRCWNAATPLARRRKDS
jgi:hypothetical protein